MRAILGRRNRPTVASDGLLVTWVLKPNVVWHDGKPCSADGVAFNWEYAKDPATPVLSIGACEMIPAPISFDSALFR